MQIKAGQTWIEKASSDEVGNIFTIKPLVLNVENNIVHFKAKQLGEQYQSIEDFKKVFKPMEDS